MIGGVASEIIPSYIEIDDELDEVDNSEPRFLGLSEIGKSKPKVSSMIGRAATCPL